MVHGGRSHQALSLRRVLPDGDRLRRRRRCRNCAGHHRWRTEWRQHKTGVDLPLSGVDCPDRRYCVAVGEGDTVLVSKDGGLRWRGVYRGLGVLDGVGCSSSMRCAGGDQRRHPGSVDHRRDQLGEHLRTLLGSRRVGGHERGRLSSPTVRGGRCTRPDRRVVRLRLAVVAHPTGHVGHPRSDQLSHRSPAVWRWAPRAPSSGPSMPVPPGWRNPPPPARPCSVSTVRTWTTAWRWGAAAPCSPRPTAVSSGRCAEAGRCRRPQCGCWWSATPSPTRWPWAWPATPRPTESPCSTGRWTAAPWPEAVRSCSAPRRTR